MALQMGESRLAYWRKVRNKTQKEVAEYVGVTQPFISKVERGVDNLSYELAANVADFLNIRMEQLHDWKEVPPYKPARE
jgi:transcriptional regulator with XRE-family HTH domain